jgi:hypothetical protein
MGQAIRHHATHEPGSLLHVFLSSLLQICIFFSKSKGTVGLWCFPVLSSSDMIITSRQLDIVIKADGVHACASNL